MGNAAIACGLRELKQLELAVQASEDEVGTRVRGEGAGEGATSYAQHTCS